MMLTKQDIKTIDSKIKASSEDVKTELGKVIHEEVENLRKETKSWIADLILQLPDRTQFVTRDEWKEEVQIMKEDISIIKDLVLMMNSKLDQDYTSVNLHLSRHDREIAELQNKL